MARKSGVENKTSDRIKLNINRKTCSGIFLNLMPSKGTLNEMLQILSSMDFCYASKNFGNGSLTSLEEQRALYWGRLTQSKNWQAADICQGHTHIQ